MVQVNGGKPIEIAAKGNGRKSSAATVKLAQGGNQIRLFNDKAYTPDIDLMRVARP